MATAASGFAADGLPWTSTSAVLCLTLAILPSAKRGTDELMQKHGLFIALISYEGADEGVVCGAASVIHQAYNRVRNCGMMRISSSGGSCQTIV